MNLQELKKSIDLAIDDCQHVIEKNPMAVLSEGDLERLLSNCISRRIGYVPENPDRDAFAVYSQISHYRNDNHKKDAQGDLLLMKPKDIEAYHVHNKGVIQKSDESFVIELKCQKANISILPKVKKDINKYINNYIDDSSFYAIILLNEHNITDKQKDAILSYYDEKKGELDREHQDKFFCRVLRKRMI